MTVPLSGGQNPAYVRLLFFSFSAERRRSVKNDRRSFFVGWGRGVGKFRVYCDLFLETNEISRYNGERLGVATALRRGGFDPSTKRMKTMASAFLTNDRRSWERRFSTAFVRLCVGAAVASWAGVGEVSAQSVGASASGGASTAYESRALFVPSLDLESPTVFSSVDAARRNRPPQPAERPEELLYPEGFLELSAPTPKPVVERPVEETKDVVATPQTPPKKEEPPRRLDPTAETTPLAPPPEPEPPKKEAGDQILFFALSFALAALGGFIYVDYRYRDRLKADLARNARLRSPNACAADFDELLISADGERLDVAFDDWAFPATLNASTAFDDEEAFEPITEPTPPNGPDLTEENFDFAPASATKPRPTLSEPEEDFIVGAR